MVISILKSVENSVKKTFYILIFKVNRPTKQYKIAINE